MSRIGKLPIAIPAGVSVALDGRMVKVKGSRGETSHVLPDGISATLEGGLLSLDRSGETTELRRMHGVTRAHLANKVKDVSEGHTITLIVNGKGFQGEVNGKILEMQIGLSHKVLMDIPSGIEVKLAQGQNTFTLTITGASRELTGSFASVLYRLRPVEPYNMIGFRYSDQVVRRKAAKTTK